MAVYSVISLVPNNGLGRSISEAEGVRSYSVTENVWYVQAACTARELSDKIGVKAKAADGTIAGSYSDIVVNKLAPSFWGYAGSDVWDFLQSSFAQDAGA